MVEYGLDWTVMMNPPVMSCAMPRPATIRMRVAMIGWTPMRATRKPFQSPKTEHAASASTTATSTPTTELWSLWRSMYQQAMAPAMAITAPTERSMPPVAMTSVMPTATSTPTTELWSLWRSMYQQAMAPAMAITAPTERSMPPVAMTSVMPIATRISGVPKMRIDTRLP